MNILAIGGRTLRGIQGGDPRIRRDDRVEAPAAPCRGGLPLSWRSCSELRSSSSRVAAPLLPRRYKEGGPNSFRLRHGQWRAIYRIDREAQEMQVQIIDTRGSVYR